MLTTIRLYTIETLKEHHPDAYQQLYKQYQDETVSYPSPWIEETLDSLKGFIKAIDFKLYDYCISSYRSYVTVHHKHNVPEIEELYGVRAYAYIMNNLDYYRIPYGCKHKNYRSYMQYGKDYRSGKIKPGPFTGYYLDEYFIQETCKAVLKGDTLKEAIESLSSLITKVVYEDEQHQLSEESFEDCCAGELFTCNGTKIDKMELELQAA